MVNTKHSLIECHPELVSGSSFEIFPDKPRQKRKRLKQVQHDIIIYLTTTWYKANPSTGSLRAFIIPALLCLVLVSSCKKEQQSENDYFHLSGETQRKILDLVYPGLRVGNEGWFINGLGHKVRIPHSSTNKNDLLADRGDFNGDGKFEIALAVVELVDNEGQFPSFNISLIYLDENNLTKAPRLLKKVVLEMLSGEVKPLELRAVPFGSKYSALEYVYHKNVGGTTGVSRNMALIAFTGSRHEIIFETVLEQTSDRSTLKHQVSLTGLATASRKSISESTTLVLHPEIGGVKSVELTGLVHERFIYQGQRMVSAGWALPGLPGILKKRKGYDIPLLVTEGVAPTALEKVPAAVIARDQFYAGLSKLDDSRQVIRGIDQWAGPSDLSAEFSFSLSNNYLELEVRVEDDAYVPGGQGEKITEGDYLILSLDLDLPGDFKVRSLNDDDLVIAAGAGNFVDLAPEGFVLHAANATVVGSSILVLSRLEDNGYRMTVRIPRQVLESIGYHGAQNLAGASIAVCDRDGQAQAGSPDHIIATSENFNPKKPLAQNNLIPTALKINLRRPVD
jgi:hypothetical protein